MKFTGLRPGEKLFEELLIGKNPKKTRHEKIYKAQDPFMPYEQLIINLDKLYFLLENNNVVEVIDLVSKLVPSYKSNSGIVDHMYKEKLLTNKLYKLCLKQKLYNQTQK